MGSAQGWAIPEYWEQPAFFVHWVDAFSAEELDVLQEEAKKANTTATVGAGEENQEIRRTSLSWLCPEEFAWAYERVAYVVAKVNFYYYKYELTSINGAIQLGNYEASNKGKYDWHIDSGGTSMRKLSFILQLSNPEEYTGGDVQIKVGPETSPTLPKGRGDMLIFPSHTLHRVTPIKSGNRQSLVAWIGGPTFK